MNFLKKLSAAILFAGVFIICAAAGNHKIRLSLDKPDGIYKKGDKVTVNISCTVKGKPCNGPIEIVIRRANWQTESRIFDVNPGKFVYNAEKSPDAIQFSVRPLNADKKPFIKRRRNRSVPVSFGIGIAVDPQNFKCGSAEPEDFKKFWDDAKAELAKIPVRELERKELKISNSMRGKHPTYFAFKIPPEMPEPEVLEGKFRAFDVKVACVGAPVSGILTMPANAAPKSLPAIVSFHGAPGGSARMAFADGVIRFDVNAHGFENLQPREYYKKLHSTKYKRYMFRNTGNRDTCYFRGMYLRAKRALDYVKSLPEYDGKTLIVVGNSQGGGQTLAAAGLDKDVKLIYASVPAMCDHGGGLVNRRPGWPRLLNCKNGKPLRNDVAKNCPYFDAAILAKYIKAEAYLTVGLVDEVCAPASVFCAYNNIPGKKHLTPMPRHGHSRTYSPEFNKRLLEVIKNAQKR